MTRPATTRGVREKKRTPARRTAHIEYQPAGLDLSGRRAREAYHAITDQAVKVGFITRAPGTALCGNPGPWADIPTLECTLVDESGGLTVVFLGRRRLAGLHPGVHMRVRGTAGDRAGTLTIINPDYDFLPHRQP